MSTPSASEEPLALRLSNAESAGSGSASGNSEAAELDAVMSAAAPLAVEKREAFLHAVAQAFSECGGIGPARCIPIWHAGMCPDGSGAVATSPPLSEFQPFGLLGG